MDGEPIVVGYVKGPRGVRGEMRVRSATDVSGRFHAGQIIYIENHMYEVLSSKIVGSEVQVFLNGISDRNQVEDLSGKEITADPYDSELLPPDTYFHYDLIGLEVREEGGAVLGNIIEVIETGANDVYVIHSEGEKSISPYEANGKVTGSKLQSTMVSVDA